MYLEHLYGLWSSANPWVHDPLCESLDQIVRTWGNQIFTPQPAHHSFFQGALAFNILSQ